MASSTAERLKELQRRLGVRPDGVLGPVTLTRLEAVVDQALGAAEAPAEEVHLQVSTVGLDALVGFEISSMANYERNLKHPIWPGAESGVTIGIGYDLGFNTELEIEEDWRGRIADADLDRLRAVAKVRGQAAKAKVAGLRDIEIPFEAARKTFFTSTLPRFARDTRRVLPGVEDLEPDAQAALLSLIYNRGPSMANKPSRREMRALRDLVPVKDLPGIAGQIRAMKRLWDFQKLPGLHKRRDREAELIEGSEREYDPEELVRV